MPAIGKSETKIILRLIVIPRFAVEFYPIETLVKFLFQNKLVEKFENEFSKKIEVHKSSAFPYGRVALLAAIEALELKNQEIIVPAYTCSVVAHAVSLSGNKVVFCDVEEETFNIDLEELRGKITTKTGAIIVTNNFGQSVNQDKLKHLLDQYNSQVNRKIYLIQDCAYSFDAQWQGKNISQFGDVSIFGLNISKSVSSIFGGMLSTNDKEIFDSITMWKEKNLKKAGLRKNLRRMIYISSAKIAFTKPLFSITYFIKKKTNLLNHLENAYHRDGKIRFPPDAGTVISKFECAVGIANLKHYHRNKKLRQDISRKYQRLILSIEEWKPIAFDDGANPSHFPVQVSDKRAVISYFEGFGIEIGEVIDYSIPEIEPYVQDQIDEYLIARKLSSSIVNLPLNLKAYNKIEKLISSNKNNFF